MASGERVPARRERKKAETRSAIVAAARRLFGERGFDAVTVVEVAEAADVSAKTVFNYFPAKEQLFFEEGPLLAGVPSEVVSGRPAGESVAGALRTLLPSSVADPAALVEWARVYHGSPALRAFGREMFAEQERALAGVLARDRGPNRVTPGILAAVVLSPVREVWETVLTRMATGTGPEDALEQGVRALGAALAMLGQGFPGLAEGVPVRTTAGGVGDGSGGVPGRVGDGSGGVPGRVGDGSGGVPGRVGDGSGDVSGRVGEGSGGVADVQAGAAGRRGERAGIMRVAALAGVSATTVSHTLNGRRPVAEKTRHRVLEAIDQLGYRPNVLARSLRTSKSQTIGLVIPDITNPFYPALARGMQDVLGPAGYDQIISNTDGERRLERSALEQMIARQVDGLAFAVFNTHAEDLLPVIERGMPVVRLGGRLIQHGVDVVHSDDESGAREATRYLLDRGYLRIGFVCGPAEEGPAAERVAGYRAALADADADTDAGADVNADTDTGVKGKGEGGGVGVDTGRGAVAGLVVHTHFSRQGGAMGAARLLDLPEPPDALLCANDVMAIGALDVAVERGLRVPDDVAIMGFDDIESASMVTPRLTTMANPAREIGQACARRLLDRLAGKVSEPYSEVVIPARLVRRESA
ncbi:substrate-binding domain-containing protein [Nonomuraea insulae]|uniref:Substrate-binding domain-containing protein n=1 Tax=Nonomuraea insulae TaxID=1616787 RepID=A0ABW1CRG0_9ACTN